MSAPYGSLSRDNLGYSVLLHWNGDKLYLRTSMEGDDTHAAIQNGWHNRRGL